MKDNGQQRRHVSVKQRTFPKLFVNKQTYNIIMIIKKLRRECVHRTQIPPPKVKFDKQEVDIRHQ